MYKCCSREFTTPKRVCRALFFIDLVADEWCQSESDKTKGPLRTCGAQTRHFVLWLSSLRVLLLNSHFVLCRSCRLLLIILLLSSTGFRETLTTLPEDMVYVGC